MTKFPFDTDSSFIYCLNWFDGPDRLKVGNFIGLLSAI